MTCYGCSCSSLALEGMGTHTGRLGVRQGLLVRFFGFVGRLEEQKLIGCVDLQIIFLAVEGFGWMQVRGLRWRHQSQALFVRLFGFACRLVVQRARR